MADPIIEALQLALVKMTAERDVALRAWTTWRGLCQPCNLKVVEILSKESVDEPHAYEVMSTFANVSRK